MNEKIRGINMRDFYKWGLRMAIILTAILHFFTYFYENSTFIQLLAISSFFIFIFTAVLFPIKKLLVPFFLLLIGLVALIISKTPFLEGVLNGFLQMRTMIGLLVIVPMISWVLREEPYIESMMSFVHRMLNTSRKLYFGIISFTQIVAYFLLFGSIPMMYQFINMILKNEKGEVWEYFKGTAILRGFSLSVMWVISIPSFIFVVEVMDASLWKSILQGLGASICGILIAVIFSHFEEKRYGVDLTASLKMEIEDLLGHIVSKQKTKRLVIEFIIIFFSLFGLIFLLNIFLSMGLMLLIPLVIFFWTVVYYIVKRRPREFFHQAKVYVEKDLVSGSFQLCIMLGAGVLIYGLNQTGFGEFVINGINGLQEIIPFINVLYLLPLMVIVLGFFGLGPLTVMVLVGGILESLNLPYQPELIVLAVSSGSAISILLSPMIMPIIVLSSVNGLNGFKNGIGFNLKYAIVIYLMVQAYVQTMVHF
jgi:hypothetical protein